MKKENKFIEDHPKALNYGLEFVEGENIDGVAYISDSEFVKVDEFSSGAKSFKTFTPVQETVSKEGIIYAEEVFEDEDDIYSNELNDRLIQKSAHRLFSTIGNEIDEALLKNGKKASIGLSLLSSMQFSRLINLEGSDARENAKALFETLGVRFFEIRNQDETNIAYNQELYEAINFAKSNKNKPVFIFVNGVEAKDLFDYLRPMYSYVDNPISDCYITAGGRNVNIPTNIWITFTLDSKDSMYQISRRIFRYTSLLDMTMLDVKASEKATVNISLEELKASLNEAGDERCIEEETWKKIDSLVNCIGRVNGYSLQNKIALRLEAFASTLFCLDKSDDEIVDIAISRCVINEAIITNDISKYVNDDDLDTSLTNSFGGDKMMLTRAAIKRYFAYAKQGGK